MNQEFVDRLTNRCDRIINGLKEGGLSASIWADLEQLLQEVRVLTNK